MFAAPPMFVLFIALGGVVVQQLWNWLTPAIFGWREVTFWQALGLLALCRILFGGLRLAGGRGPGRWGHMSPEERQRFREAMHQRFGLDPSADQGKVQ